MSFDAFLETAWKDHGDHPEAVADRLAGALGLVEKPEHIGLLARLATHVLGEHLGQWQRGIDLLSALRGLPAFDGSEEVAAGPVRRSIAALRYASGDGSVLASLSVEDRTAVLASAAAAFTGRSEFKRAIAAYGAALELTGAGLPHGSPAIRSLAIAGNNLAAALEEKKDRDDVETQGMIAAARGGLQYWKLAGTWLEEERAEYRLARSLIQAGQATAAIECAERCIDVCKRNDAPPFEQFFGHAVLAVAQRAAGQSTAFAESRRVARRLFEQVPADEKSWCEAELKELGD
jgi:tetratricopeptide (TPR) repeat protein